MAGSKKVVWTFNSEVKWPSGTNALGNKMGDCRDVICGGEERERKLN